MKWICTPFLTNGCRNIKNVFNFGIFGCEKTLHPKRQEFSEGARRILLEQNAGGSSEISEALSFEFFQRKYNAILLKTETEIKYNNKKSPKTDYLCEIDRVKVAISVTRITSQYNPKIRQMAERVLQKKIENVLQSNKNNLENWTEQLLHVWVQTKEEESILVEVFKDPSFQVEYGFYLNAQNLGLLYTTGLKNY